MNPITIEVLGEPMAQPRARSFVLRGKGGKPILKNGEPILRVHEAGTAENWKSLIAVEAKPHVPFVPLQGPIRLDIEFRFQRPKAHFRANGVELKPNAPVYHTGKPDRDNLEKAVMDALTTLGLWSDDGQVCAGEVTKVYVPRHPNFSSNPMDSRQGATITISEPAQALGAEPVKVTPNQTLNLI